MAPWVYFNTQTQCVAIFFFSSLLTSQKNLRARSARHIWVMRARILAKFGYYPSLLCWPSCWADCYLLLFLNALPFSASEKILRGFFFWVFQITSYNFLYSRIDGSVSDTGSNKKNWRAVFWVTSQKNIARKKKNNNVCGFKFRCVCLYTNTRCIFLFENLVLNFFFSAPFGLNGIIANFLPVNTFAISH